VINDRFSDFEKKRACAMPRRVLAALALFFSPLPLSSMAMLLAMLEVAIAMYWITRATVAQSRRIICHFLSLLTESAPMHEHPDPSRGGRTSLRTGGTLSSPNDRLCEDRRLRAAETWRSIF
jgi:hypothetical protein